MSAVCGGDERGSGEGWCSRAGVGTVRTGERKLGLTAGSGVSGGVTVEGHLQEEMAMEKQAPAAARLTTTGCRVLTTLPTQRLDVSPCPSCPARPTVISIGTACLCGSSSNTQRPVSLPEPLQKGPLAKAIVAGRVTGTRRFRM